MEKVYVVYKEWKEDSMRDLMSVHSTQEMLLKKFAYYAIKRVVPINTDM